MMGAVRKLTEYIAEFWDQRLADPAALVPRHGEVNAQALFGDAFRSPLIETDAPLLIRSETDHAFFLRLCELYRVLELLQRTQPLLIETYSKFRERKQFEETLRLRYFETDDGYIAAFDPNLTAILLAIFNHLIELRIFLRYTDALPSTIDTHIGEALLSLTENWNALVDGAQAKFAWSFKKL